MEQSTSIEYDILTLMLSKAFERAIDKPELLRAPMALSGDESPINIDDEIFTPDNVVC